MSHLTRNACAVLDCLARADNFHVCFPAQTFVHILEQVIKSCLIQAYVCAYGGYCITILLCCSTIVQTRPLNRRWQCQGTC